jgi:hypothetical protein
MLRSKKVQMVNEERTKFNTTRAIPDRRKRPTSLLNSYIFRGDRRGNRRITDTKKVYYVDKFNTTEWTTILLLTFLCIADAILTLHHLNKGFRELNPLLNSFLIYGGKTWFIIIKFGITAPCLLFLFLHCKNILAKKGVWMLVGVYSILLIYHFTPIVL